MKKICLFVMLWTLVGCSHTAANIRLDSAERLAAEHNWQQLTYQTTTFELISYSPVRLETSETLTVYIEGDGFAWQSSRRPSSDPTPHNPLALKLALQHHKGAAAYLARPCQYQQPLDKEPLCQQSYWTNKRYAEEVISASEQALTQIKIAFAAKHIILVGYSGGAAVAALLAARRDDVTALITLAGNLDHKAWTQLHRVSPLIGSLNPVDYQQQLQAIPQIHFVGENDQIIPASLIQDFVAGYDSPKLAKVIVIANQSHHCCWQTVWQKLIEDSQLY